MTDWDKLNFREKLSILAFIAGPLILFVMAVLTL